MLSMPNQPKQQPSDQVLERLKRATDLVARMRIKGIRFVSVTVPCANGDDRVYLHVEADKWNVAKGFAPGVPVTETEVRNDIQRKIKADWFTLTCIVPAHT